MLWGEEDAGPPTTRRAVVSLTLFGLLWLAASFGLLPPPARGATVPIDPATIEGEAGIAGCPEAALVAVAWTNANHVYRYGHAPTWYGRAQPSHASYHIARYWPRYADPTRGAIHLFSFRDTATNPAVRKLIQPLELTFEIRCPGGTGLRAYR